MPPGWCGEAEGVPIRSHAERTARLREVVEWMGRGDLLDAHADVQLAAGDHLSLGPTREQEAYARGRRDALRDAAKLLRQLVRDAAGDEQRAYDAKHPDADTDLGVHMGVRVGLQQARCVLLCFGGFREVLEAEAELRALFEAACAPAAAP